MFRFIFIAICIVIAAVNAFHPARRMRVPTSAVTALFSSKELPPPLSSSDMELPNFKYCIYDESKPTYLVIAKNNKKFRDMFEEMVRSQINFLVIDIAFYDFNELIKICEYYNFYPGTSIEVFEDPIVFLEDKEYIGGAFEMYQIILRA